MSTPGDRHPAWPGAGTKPAEETSGRWLCPDPEAPLGLIGNFAVIGAVACAAVHAVARLVALLIVLRGTRPGERAELVRAVADLFRRGRRNRADHTR